MMPYKSVEELTALGIGGSVHPYAELFGVAHKMPVDPQFFNPKTRGLGKSYFRALVNFSREEIKALDAFCYEIKDWYWKQIKSTSREEAEAMGFSPYYADLYNKYMQALRAGQRFRKETRGIRKMTKFGKKVAKTASLRARRYKEAAARCEAMGQHAQAQSLYKSAAKEEAIVAKWEKQRSMARKYLGYKQKAVVKEIQKKSPPPITPKPVVTPTPVYYAPPEKVVTPERVVAPKKVVEAVEKDVKPSVAPLVAAGIGGAILVLLLL